MSKQELIVIVSDKMDPHTDLVLMELRSMGHHPVRLHPADFPEAASVTLTFDQQHWNGQLSVSKGPIDINEIKSIWWRRPEPHVISADLSRGERAFARQETQHTFLGLWSVIDCYWMSYPLYIRRASNKIEQLQRAAQLGFRVPRTLVTNDPEQVLAFYDSCGGSIIYKTLDSPYLQLGSTEPAKGLAVYTNRITREHLALLETVRTAPCQFQELIPKQVELRVTIIGDDLFVCEIHSQDDARTSLDWRHYEAPVPYTKGTLPPEIADKCFGLAKGYGLNFSAIDLILTPEGEYVFLENNPNGQCLFIQEHIPEFKMVQAIAARLLRGKA